MIKRYKPIFENIAKFDDYNIKELDIDIENIDSKLTLNMLNKICRIYNNIFNVNLRIEQKETIDSNFIFKFSDGTEMPVLFMIDVNLLEYNILIHDMLHLALNKEIIYKFNQDYQDALYTIDEHFEEILISKYTGIYTDDFIKTLINFLIKSIFKVPAEKYKTMSSDDKLNKFYAFMSDFLTKTKYPKLNDILYKMFTKLPYEKYFNYLKTVIDHTNFLNIDINEKISRFNKLSLIEFKNFKKIHEG